MAAPALQGEKEERLATSALDARGLLGEKFKELMLGESPKILDFIDLKAVGEACSPFLSR